LRDRIGRITTAGVVTEYSAGITPGSVPVSITAGGDGALWFTEAYGPRIARITTGGVVTEYSAGITAGSVLYGIAAGPDGALWFTEYVGNRIGRVSAPGLEVSSIPALSVLGALLMAVLLAAVSIFLLQRA
jgi:virginiamycin B lyase